MAKTVIAKLGGSVITDKTKPFSYRADVVSALAEEVASSGESVVIVHGGGSYGHTVARQHGLSSNSSNPTAAGVPQTRAAMFELNSLVCKTMVESKLSPYTFAPFDAFADSGNSSAIWLRSLMKAGVTPVTFGDVVFHKGGFKVLSGDYIMLELAKLIKPDRCVFAMDVDGVYEPDARVIVPELTVTKVRKMKVPRGDDATGGMGLKLEVAAKVASLGCRVSFVSGYRRNEFSKALRGLDFYGTTVRA